MAKNPNKLNAPTTVGLTVPPCRRPGMEYDTVGEYPGFGDINQLEFKVDGEAAFTYKAKAKT